VFRTIVHEMSMDEKKRILAFTTGSDRVPIRGLSDMKFIISRQGPESDRYVFPLHKMWHNNL